MRSRQLICFVRVCELGSITKAALTLNIAQPALGLQIRALEKEFGVQLLTRTAEGVMPTVEGKIFLDEARFVLGRLDELKRTLRESADNKRRRFAIGMPPSLAANLAQPMLEALMKLAPDRAVALFEDASRNLVELVGTGHLDLALAFNVDPSRQITREAKMRDALYFVTKPGSRFDAPGPISFEEVTKADLAMPSSYDVIRRLTEEIARERNLSLKVAYQVQSMQAIKGFVAQGVASTVFSYIMVGREIAEGKFVARLIVDPIVERTLYAIRAVNSEPVEAHVDQALDELLKALYSNVPPRPAF